MYRGFMNRDIKSDDFLTKEEMNGDIDDLIFCFRNQWSYFKLNPTIDRSKAFRDLRHKVNSTRIHRAEYVREILKLTAQFGDGHSGADSVERWLKPGYLPFLPKYHQGRIALLKPDGSDYLEHDHPYAVSLDGLDVGKWQDAARAYVVRGSPQAIQRDTAHMLRYVNQLRFDLGLPEKKDLQVDLESADGNSKARLTLASAAKRVSGRLTIWPTEHKLLEDNIGYLRLARMSSLRRDPKWVVQLAKTMKSYRHTDGLIIDVRGNTGGSRDALEVLFPFLMAPNEDPYIANVAAYRLNGSESKSNPLGYLSRRHLYPLNWHGWKDQDRAAIRVFSEGFEPRWKLPQGEFSDWHYFVLTADPSRTWHYTKPVVILMNGDCFSATDIFLGAFKGRPGVTLVGTASGGGSGASVLHQFHQSGLKLILASMASFRPNGMLYERTGIQPDRTIHATLDDLIGKSDSLLDLVSQHLRVKDGSF